MIRSGRSTPEEKMAPLDLAVPYAAPNTVNITEAAQPIAPKNDWWTGEGYVLASHVLGLAKCSIL
jgi:hypothetical protein